jgi:hypothetical protein
MHFKNHLLGAAAAVALMSFAVPAFATDYVFTGTSMTNPDIVSVDGEGVYMAPMDFQGVQSIEAWCLDVTHFISLGAQNPALEYNKETLTTSTMLNGNPSFGALQIGEISYLINILAPTLAPGHALNEVQGAIWDITLGGVGHVTSGDSGIQAGIDHFATLGLTSGRTVIGLESTGITPNVQDFGMAGGVPEPAAWALMLLGFGGLGAALRHQRRAAFA